MMQEALDDLDDARVSRCTQMQFTVIPISVLQSNDLDNRHHHLHCHNNDDIDEKYLFLVMTLMNLMIMMRCPMSI